MPEPEITTKIIEAASAGFITTASLAAGLKISGDQVIASYDVIQAAGYNLMRVPGSGGGVKIISKPRRSRRHEIEAQLSDPSEKTECPHGDPGCDGDDATCHDGCDHVYRRRWLEEQAAKTKAA